VFFLAEAFASVMPSYAIFFSHPERRLPRKDIADEARFRLTMT
jgi:hypothetical protein